MRTVGRDSSQSKPKTAERSIVRLGADLRRLYSSGMDIAANGPPSLDGADAEDVRAALREVARFADVFPRAGFVAGEWRVEPGVMPYFAQGADITAFAQAAYRAGLVFPFDWSEWSDEAARLSADPEALAQADLVTVAKLLTTIIRQDRFVEGSLGSCVESGLVTDILRRLTALVDG